MSRSGLASETREVQPRDSSETSHQICAYEEYRDGYVCETDASMEITAFGPGGVGD